MNVSNIGAKISYTETEERDFLPTNLRLGSALSMYLDDFNTLTLTADFNKLLVPSPPQYNLEGDEIISGRDPDVGVAAGIFGSFTDAPGVVLYDDDGNFDGIVKNSVFREEMREVNISVGLEYEYANQFAFRTGFLSRRPYKRK